MAYRATRLPELLQRGNSFKLTRELSLLRFIKYSGGCSILTSCVSTDSGPKGRERQERYNPDFLDKQQQRSPRARVGHKTNPDLQKQHTLKEMDNILAPRSEKEEEKKGKLRSPVDLRKQPGISLDDQRSPIKIAQNMRKRLSEAIEMKKEKMTATPDLRHLDTSDKELMQSLYKITNFSRPFSVPRNSNISSKLSAIASLGDIKTEKSFIDLGIHPKLVASLAKLGITIPTEVQRKCLELISSDSDIVIHSETGSGKTLAFLLPILQEPGLQCGTVIIVPSRELAFQIYEVACSLLSKSSIVGVYVRGMEEEEEMIKRFREQTPRILIGTPKAVKFIISENEEKFSKVSRVVLDEVDRILLQRLAMRKKKKKKLKPNYAPEEGHHKAYEIILAALQALNNKKIQRIASTATVDATLINELHDLGWREGLKIIKSSALTDEPYKLPSCIEHNHIVFVEDKGITSNTALLRAYRAVECKSALVFVKSLTSPVKLVQTLQAFDIRAVALHAELSASTSVRDKFLADFRTGLVEMAVATEDIVRGLDFKDLDHVILTMVPNTSADYIHLAGRVGRQGRPGTVTTIISLKNDEDMKRYQSIMRDLGLRSTPIEE